MCCDGWRRGGFAAKQCEVEGGERGETKERVNCKEGLATTAQGMDGDKEEVDKGDQ